MIHSTKKTKKKTIKKIIMPTPQELEVFRERTDYNNKRGRRKVEVSGDHSQRTADSDGGRFPDPLESPETR